MTAASLQRFRAGGTCCSGGGFCTRRPCDPHRRTRSGPSPLLRDRKAEQAKGRKAELKEARGRRREDPTTGQGRDRPVSRMPGQSCPTSTVASQNSAPISNTQNKNDSSPRTPRRLPASRFESPEEELREAEWRVDEAEEALDGGRNELYRSEFLTSTAVQVLA